MVQQVMFWKNMSMLGAALVLVHFGAGPLSVDAAVYKARSEELRDPSIYPGDNVN
jgi:uncharacterized membrane protein YphA (DoxX/SURF4 family)